MPDFCGCVENNVRLPLRFGLIGTEVSHWHEEKGLGIFHLGEEGLEGRMKRWMSRKSEHMFPNVSTGVQCYF